MPRIRNGGRLAALFFVASFGVPLAACGGHSAPPATTVAEGSPSSATAQAASSSPSPIATATATVTPARDPELAAREGRFEAAAAGFANLAASAKDPEARASALLKQAVALADAGFGAKSLAIAREAVAVAPAASAVASEAGLFAARALLTAGAPREALTLLTPLSGAAPAGLQPYVLSLLTQAALGAGETALADVTWTQLLALPNLPLSIAEGAYAGQAEAARQAGDRPRYVVNLTRLLSVNDTASIRYELAAAYRASGDEEKRLAQLRVITASFPAHPLAVTALKELRDAGAPIDAAQEGFIFYRAGALGDALAALEAAVAQPARGGQALAFATFYLGATLEDLRRPAEAIAAYDRVPSIAPSSVYAHRARYWAARVMETTRDYTSASVRYVELANSTTTGEFTSEAAFRAGYVLFESGAPVSASETWSRIAQPDARVLYWKGRALEDVKDAEGARRAFEAAAAAGPLDFHGVEALRRLGRLPEVNVTYRERDLSRGPDWPLVETWLAAHFPKTGGALPVKDTTLATQLAAAGLRSEASDAIWDALGRSSDPWMVLDALRLAHGLVLTSTSARLADRLVALAGGGWAAAPVGLLAAGYPAGYPAILDAEAKAADVDPLFLAALIRVESFWQVDAISPAGALGLTQVMPATGQGIASELGVPEFAPLSLLQAPVSLRFGAYYIGVQLRQYRLPHAALAAYNAGPGRASAWLARWSGGTAAEFVEVIDIEETRAYVELVLQGYARYEAAYRAGR